MSHPKRPLGVTLVGALWLVRGAVSVALGAFALAAVAAAVVSDVGPKLEPLVHIAGSFIGLFGVITLSVGVLELLLAGGLLQGRYWAWLIALVIEVIRTVTSVLTISRTPLSDLLQILVSVIVIAYLLQPQVRMFYERVQPPPPPHEAPPQVLTA